MKLRYLIVSMLVGITLASVAAASDLNTLYDVDFTAPTHQDGQPPTTGSGPLPRDTVSEIKFGDPEIFQIFSNGNLSFVSPGDPYDQVSFTGDGLPDFTRYVIDVSFSAAALEGSRFTVLVDAPAVRRFTFLGDGTIEFHAEGVTRPVGTWQSGPIVSLRIEYDITTDLFEAWYGAELILSEIVPDTRQFNAVRLSASGDAWTVLVNHVKIEGGPAAVPTESVSWSSIKARF